ncbi:LPXTG motif leucine-rich repeat domain protein [Weissella oryzae SG25]|uniref:LPXTG motif leucine-rich repeat domain protein n=1 Tax=Weissella oryzae (strain DSM 25784 / JCM 18191 / LMG 30913 / SG25) TaxID=1329250 RepID=A0A069CRP7_WEIOS|nr:MucBP domain-containing protein [Weissella oryzae]GAK30047.1 LPXTG motif leucine-rich repeat domain protein [Weissella oryzae SG25]
MAEYDIMGTPIWVYYKDSDTKATIQPPKIVEGGLGSIFSIKADQIENYQLTRTEGEVNGIFDETMHTITFYYRKANWAETEVLTNKYIIVMKDTPIYATITGEEPVDVMRENSTWKVTTRVATKNGKFWYQLADSRWIMYARNNIKLVDSPNEALLSTQGDVALNKWPTKPLKAMANIDYVANSAVSVYYQPYGREMAMLPNGRLVEVSEVMEDPSGVNWYHLKPAGWINGIYLKFQEE